MENNHFIFEPNSNNFQVFGIKTDFLEQKSTLENTIQEISGRCTFYRGIIYIFFRYAVLLISSIM